jgi:hypothetical protein
MLVLAPHEAGCVMTKQPGSLHERLAALYAELADVHRRLASDEGALYYDQRSSPLGPRLHCGLVRSGAIPGFRAGRRILIRRVDLDAYLERHRIEPTKVLQESPDEIDQLLATVGGRAA